MRPCEGRVGTLGAGGGVLTGLLNELAGEGVGGVGEYVLNACAGAKGGGVGRLCANASPIGSVGVWRDGGAVGVAAIPIEITPLQVEQRARTPPVGTFAGSTRYTVEHSGQLTFILLLQPHSVRVMAPRTPEACHRFGDRSNRPSLQAFSRKSSFP